MEVLAVLGLTAGLLWYETRKRQQQENGDNGHNGEDPFKPVEPPSTGPPTIAPPNPPISVFPPVSTSPPVTTSPPVATNPPVSTSPPVTIPPVKTVPPQDPATIPWTGYGPQQTGGGSTSKSAFRKNGFN